MSNLDPTVASLVDRHNVKPPPSSSTREADVDSDSDTDALLESLENEDNDDLSHLRERRIQQLAEEMSRATALKSSGTGTYTTVTSRTSPPSTSYPEGDPNKAVLDMTTGHERAVVHFFKTDFARCGIMDSHLKRLAERHYEVRFARVDVGEVPFLVEKLKIRILPCVIAFVKGVAIERVVGFEGLHGDGFKTGQLERRLINAGVLVRSKMEAAEENGAAHGLKSMREIEEEDEGDDWD